MLYFLFESLNVLLHQTPKLGLVVNSLLHSLHFVDQHINALLIPHQELQLIRLRENRQPSLLGVYLLESLQSLHLLVLFDYLAGSIRD